MLTETSPRVLAGINLHAVLGALPKLAELAPRAREILTRLRGPVVLTLRVIGGDATRWRFTSAGISSASEGTGTRATLLLRSPQHLNAVMAGTAQPIPIAGPAGLRFLTGVFTPLTDLLSRYLQPSPDDLADEHFADVSRRLTLEVAVTAMTVVANEDRSGRFSAEQMPDGDLDIAVGDAERFRLRVRDHQVALIAPTGAPARASFAFADLRTAGDVLAGRESSLVCVGDGRIAIRGYVPLADNASRILDRVGHYL